MFESQTPVMSCSSCISAMQVVKRMSYLSESLLINSLVKLCQRTDKVDHEVCQGTIEEQAPVLRKVIKTMDVSGRDGHLLCAAVLNACPYPDILRWNISFPKAKPLRPTLKSSQGRYLSVIQLSDWHVDPYYEPGSEVQCNKPICCRSSYTDYSNITTPASLWGAYNCDTPISLIESMLEYIPTIEPNLAFGMLTGDLPPHEVWSTLPINKTQGVQDDAYRLLHAHFDSFPLINTMLYPSVGNHESAPTNVFPLKHSRIKIEASKNYLNMRWLYKSLSESWKGWLGSEALAQVERNSGSYTVKPVRGLKLISLNTNFCYTLNWWLYENPHTYDPNGILSWLVRQLQQSEDEEERVWIMGHVAPGDETCLHDYSNYYHQIVERYSPHVIAGQFFGHTHKDEFQVSYKHQTQTASNAISTVYIAPSVTPYLNTNPAFRIYKVDADTFEVYDAITYYAQLNASSEWKYGPVWEKEYSAREAFTTPLSPLSAKSPLTAAWWHNVTEAMVSDPSLLDTYWKYRSSSAPVARLCDSEECRANAICTLRAGKSEQRCDYISDVLSSTNPPPSPNKEICPCSLDIVSIRHDL
ncbi:Metallo-dependent phosphatase-like protein [Spinellus fusiger]|nr:Metallo-dependent phosphatase-like protein [Spinellus fusiger]